MSTVVTYVERIFLKVLFIKMNNKTKDQIQSWLTAEKYCEELGSASQTICTT